MDYGGNDGTEEVERRTKQGEKKRHHDNRKEIHDGKYIFIILNKMGRDRTCINISCVFVQKGGM